MIVASCPLSISRTNQGKPRPTMRLSSCHMAAYLHLVSRNSSPTRSLVPRRLISRSVPSGSCLKMTNSTNNCEHEKDRTAKKPDSGIGESVIRLMTRLSMQYGAVNLSQGFPNEPPPLSVRLSLARAVLTGVPGDTDASNGYKVHASCYNMNISELEPISKLS